MIKYNELILFESLVNDTYDEFVKKLFDYSSLINHVNHEGESLLHHVCLYGLIDKFYALINMGAEISVTYKKNSLLHYAAYGGKDNFLIVELVKLGIYPTQPNIEGMTPLHMVANKQIANYLHLWCNRNNIEIQKLLDSSGNSVVHIAYLLKNFEVIEYWLHHYPEMNNIKNIYGQSWQETNISNISII